VSLAQQASSPTSREIPLHVTVGGTHAPPLQTSETSSHKSDCVQTRNLSPHGVRASRFPVIVQSAAVLHCPRLLQLFPMLAVWHSEPEQVT
jgi:hypothetical protein